MTKIADRQACDTSEKTRPRGYAMMVIGVRLTSPFVGHSTAKVVNCHALGRNMMVDHCVGHVSY